MLYLIYIYVDWGKMMRRVVVFCFLFLDFVSSGELWCFVFCFLDFVSSGELWCLFFVFRFC